jgi:hypothetical protein
MQQTCDAMNAANAKTIAAIGQSWSPASPSPPSPPAQVSFSAPQSRSAMGTSSYPSYSYEPDGLLLRLITAPFRLVWALVMLLVRVGLWVVKLAAVLALIAVVFTVVKALDKPRSTSSTITVPTTPVVPRHAAAGLAVPAAAPVARWFASIGVLLEDLNAQNTAALRLAVGEGAYVRSVFAGSPAARANLLPGDIILDVGNVRVRGASSTVALLRNSIIGRELPINIVRGGQPYTARPLPQAATDSSLDRVVGQ